jgi:clan AA aspartic protease
MGKVMPTIRLTNEDDYANRNAGLDVPLRSIEMPALVDTGATMLVLPAEVVAKLGLRTLGASKVRLADGRREDVLRVGPVRLEILGRPTTCEALVLPTGTQALIGQIPLEALDLIVDPKSQEVRPNPASPDAPLLDLLAVA